MQSHPESLTEDQAGKLTAAMQHELGEFLALCGETLVLAQEENQALAQKSDYAPTKFNEKRKALLEAIQKETVKVRGWRVMWSQIQRHATVHSNAVKALLEESQNVLMRVLLLDRENQQAMLRRGLVPATHLPAAAGQQPHFVAGMYQRHSRSS